MWAVFFVVCFAQKVRFLGLHHFMTHVDQVVNSMVVTLKMSDKIRAWLD